MVELAAVMCDGNEIVADDITFNATRNEENFLTDEKTLREYTLDIIRLYLKRNNNDVIATAKKLDIGKSTIYKMLQDGDIK
jgi:DNA-binding NtrC family response regulator